MIIKVEGDIMVTLGLPVIRSLSHAIRNGALRLVYVLVEWAVPQSTQPFGRASRRFHEQVYSTSREDVAHQGPIGNNVALSGGNESRKYGYSQISYKDKSMIA
jgi:hypothetical protein